jgi:bacterioferritin-associated ferredoxin
MSVTQPAAKTLICYCYEVSELQIRRAIEVAGTRTIEDLSQQTGAGSGCTACHYRLRRLLAGLPVDCSAGDCSAGDGCGQCGGSGCDCERTPSVPR